MRLFYIPYIPTATLTLNTLNTEMQKDVSILHSDQSGHHVEGHTNITVIIYHGSHLHHMMHLASRDEQRSRSFPRSTGEWSHGEFGENGNDVSHMPRPFPR